MACFTNNPNRAVSKRARVQSASSRVRRATLRVEVLEQRSLLTSIVPISAPLPDVPAADDVIVDGRIITGENFDAAIPDDPSIVHTMPGRTSFQPAGESASGGSTGHDILFGGLGSDGDLESPSSAHSGGVNALFGDGSVRFVSDSIDTTLSNGFQGETDTAAQSGPYQSDYKYVSVRPAASSPTNDTSDDFRGQISYTGLEQAAAAVETQSFVAFGNFTGGVFVGAGDVNGDGVDDIIVSAGGGAGGHVKVIDGSHISVSGRVTSVVVDPSIDYEHTDLYTSVWVN